MKKTTGSNENAVFKASNAPRSSPSMQQTSTNEVNGVCKIPPMSVKVHWKVDYETDEQPSVGMHIEKWWYILLYQCWKVLHIIMKYPSCLISQISF